VAEFEKKRLNPAIKKVRCSEKKDWEPAEAENFANQKRNTLKKKQRDGRLNTTNLLHMGQTTQRVKRETKRRGVRLGRKGGPPQDRLFKKKKKKTKPQ